MELHWLPVEARIHYKTAVLVFKSLSKLAPKYLQELITNYKNPRDSLQSENSHTINKKSITQRWCGDRSFAFAAGHIWNNLPIDLRKCKNFDSFKKDFKTCLFEKFYNCTS